MARRSRGRAPALAHRLGSWRRADVRDTVVDGRLQMRDRDLRPLDEGAVLADLEILAAS
ncbi:hypothetical protein AB0N07_17495 [Streptomyces sp. NPDC051172]|uniref:hypothetical protein n=1 Tax=Streptomyces sp. NPDC051172 TaxID=3155796 RepID=UPI003417EB7B